MVSWTGGCHKMGERQYRGLRRRPQPHHNRWRIGRFDVGKCLDGFASLPGLFAQAMGSSGSVMGFKKVLTLKEAEQKGVEMAQKIAAQMVGKTDKTKGKASKKKAPKADIDMLRNLPAEELLKLASVKSLPVYNIDGYFFVEQPEVTFAKGNQTKVPLLVGGNNRR